MRALLLEPHGPTRELLVRALGERGWHVEPAESPAEALRSVQASTFALVVLGCEPDGESAAALCHALRASPLGSTARILVVGPEIDAETARRLAEAGADDFLARPVCPGGLAARLGFAEGRLHHSAAPPPAERAAYRHALQQSEARYRALFDQSPVGVFLCDAQLRITHCNERLTEILRARYEEIVGTGLLDLRDDRIRPVLEQARTGEPACYEGPYVAPSRGKRLWISVRYAPLRAPDGSAAGGIGVVEDITEREEAQRRLRSQTAELERVNATLRERTLELETALQARTRLYSAMNHELRTPISAIMLYQELLMAGTLGPLAAEQREALERSHTSTRHLLALVQDVLDLAKLEAGRVSVHPVEVWLPALLHDLCATVQPLAQRYGSTVRLDADTPPPSVVTDPQRLRQILLNLLSNAAKFGRGRPITLRCRAPSDDTVVIEVVDRGVGIAATDLPRIFEDFVQVGSGQDGGTGLGLGISRRLAELLGGRLEVESQPGVGSTFRLVLPAASAPRESTLLRGGVRCGP